MFDKEKRKQKKAVDKYGKTTEMPMEKRKAKLMKFSVEDLMLVEKFLLDKKVVTEKEVDSHQATIEKLQKDETMDTTGRNLSILFAQQYLEGYEKILKEINQELSIIADIKKTFVNDPENENL